VVESLPVYITKRRGMSLTVRLSALTPRVRQRAQCWVWTPPCSHRARTWEVRAHYTSGSPLRV